MSATNSQSVSIKGLKALGYTRLTAIKGRYVFAHRGHPGALFDVDRSGDVYVTLHGQEGRHLMPPDAQYGFRRAAEIHRA
jgi:hypothetical protein